MSRQTKLGKLVKEGMNANNSDYSDNEEENYSDEEFTEQQYEKIDTLKDMFKITQNEAISHLKQSNFAFDEAVNSIQHKLQKQKRHKEKQEKKKIKQEEKKMEKQVEALNLQKKKTSDNLSKNSDMPKRKISTDSDKFTPTNFRKNSSFAQQYETDHYNIQYPSLEVDSDIQPSKTINIVVVGHVDSGKSTLVGMFLHQMNQISKKQMHKNQKQSKQMGKQSFKYAWVTDATQEERVRGVTIDVGVKKIILNDKQIVFLDSPGHRDFIPNMITGAAQADYAILVVDVTHFDSTFISGGQTKQHAYIVKSLGVHKIIIAMNKMDLIQWDSVKFETIKKKLNYYLHQIGFKQDTIIYVPLSAVNGINITKKRKEPFKSNETVYNSTLAQVISNLELPIRLIDKPLRISVTNFYESQLGKLKGHCISGKIQGGVLKKDDKLVILPQNTQCIVKQILKNNEKVKIAIVGDNIDILIKLIDQNYFQTIKYGNILSSLKYSIPVSKRFIVQALALQLQNQILKGTQVIIYLGTNKQQAVITKINYIFNPNDGTILKKNPKMIKSNDCAQIQIQTKNKICVQLFSNYKIFGRIIIRQKKETLAVGTIKKIK